MKCTSVVNVILAYSSSLHREGTGLQQAMAFLVVLLPRAPRGVQKNSATQAKQQKE